MIRLGVVGTSAICEKFITAARAAGRFAFCAVHSRDAARGAAFAQKHGFARSFTELREMAKAVDAVYIASPNVCHAAQSRLFLRAGVHVLCEKPIAVSAQEYSLTKALADRQGLIYIEAIIPRFVEDRAAIVQALSEIGPLSLVRISYSQRSSRLDAFLAGETPNIFNMSLHAGALMDLGVYCVYGALDLLGKPKAIEAKAHFRRGCDTAGSVLLDYGDFPALLTYSKTGDTALGSEFIGQRGTLRVQMISLYSGLSLVRNGQTVPLGSDLDRISRMRGEAIAFADLIEGNRNDYQNLSELTLSVHRCMDGIKRKANIQYKEETI